MSVLKGSLAETGKEKTKFYLVVFIPLFPPSGYLSAFFIKL